MPDRTCLPRGVRSLPLGYRVDARTHGNGTKMRVLREIRQVSVDALPAATRAHVAITVQNVDGSSDKTDKPNESPSCFGLGGKGGREMPSTVTAAVVRGEISLLSN